MKVLFLILASLSYCFAQSCAFTSDGVDYNIEALQKSGSGAYTKTDEGGNDYFWNICQQVDCPSCAPCQAEMPGSSVCQLAGNGIWYSGGVFSTQALSASAKDKQVYIDYESGSSRDGCEIKARQTTIKVTCVSTDATTIGSITHAENDDCGYIIEMNSPAACPGGSADGGTPGDGSDMAGWIVVIVIVSGFFLYFAIGIAIGVKNGASGSEKIPHHEFWLGLPGLVKDGCVFTKDKCLGLVGKGGGSYSTV